MFSASFDRLSFSGDVDLNLRPSNDTKEDKLNHIPILLQKIDTESEKLQVRPQSNTILRQFLKSVRTWNSLVALCFRVKVIEDKIAPVFEVKHEIESLISTTARLTESSVSMLNCINMKNYLHRSNLVFHGLLGMNNETYEGSKQNTVKTHCKRAWHYDKQFRS